MSDVDHLDISLAAGPKHGYALITDIEQFAGVRLGAGTLYGVLARLEDAGLVAALPADERRHPYEITAEGRRRSPPSSGAIVRSRLSA